MDDLPVTTITAPGGALSADFVPAAGMVCVALRHRGDQLLGLRDGLGAYVTERKTMGIPLLHPWANRIATADFELAGREVRLGSAQPSVRIDTAGLPMHGLNAGVAWRVVPPPPGHGPGSALAAELDFGSRPELIAAFPFPQRLLMNATIDADALTIRTSISATGEVPVPIAFGHHPYLTLPGVERSDWLIEAPVATRLELDDRMLPTGQLQPASIEAGPLGRRTFDDAYLAPVGGQAFALSGGARRIEVRFDQAYTHAQVFAPAADAVVAFEPMTAPTNALISQGPELRMVAPGDTFAASFSIAVSDTVAVA